MLDLGHGFELFGVDDCTLPSERHCAAGVTRATAPRHDGQTQIDTAFDQARHLNFGVRRKHHKRVFDAPVGRIRHMGHARQTVKLDVVVGRVFFKLACCFFTQARNRFKLGVKGFHCAARSF